MFDRLARAFLHSSRLCPSLVKDVVLAYFFSAPEPSLSAPWLSLQYLETKAITGL